MTYRRGAPCPVCGGWDSAPRGRGVRCGGKLLAGGAVALCMRRPSPWARPAANAWLHRLVGCCRCPGLHTATAQVPSAATSSTVPSSTTFSTVALEVWARTRQAPGTVAEAYLRARGITLPLPPSLRFAPALRHSASGTTWPALVAAVTRWPSTHPVAIQRTWLQHDGSAKAPVAPNKMSLGPQAGGAVRLAPATQCLVVAEGIETALSVQQATGYPAWAVLGAGCMVGLVLPALPLAATVVIAADADDDGSSIKYAQAAQYRWVGMGRQVHIALPPSGLDFNDLLRLGGVA